MELEKVDKPQMQSLFLRGHENTYSYSVISDFYISAGTILLLIELNSHDGINPIQISTISALIIIGTFLGNLPDIERQPQE